MFASAPDHAGETMQFLWMRVDALTLICLLLFMGAMGKSAQFLLHTWLPDAMEGPTPVSALIHAATMVTAGVFMVARLSPLFELSPTALAVVAVAGGVVVLSSAADPRLGIDGPAFTSLAQGALRQNTYIGFSAAFALYGTDGLAAAAIWVAAVTPIANVYCIGLLMRHGTAAQPGARACRSTLAPPANYLACLGASRNL